MASTVRINHSEIQSYLNGEHGVDAFLEGRAELALAAARSSAPVASGTYRDSLRIETERHPTRIVKRVVADVPYAMVVEANTGNLSRALDAAK